ncbi:hypothetical protein EPO15_01410 [bacterium]|nr:MAG: hypothetical protein EPO15_01410 [bacterium]
MGRPWRLHVPGAIYHVVSRGSGGQTIFLSDADRLLFLGMLEEEVRRAGAAVLSVCLMGNHFHVLIRIGDIPLSVVMQRLLCRYARYFNAAHDSQGHFFQSRFKAKLCDDIEYLITLLRYIHMNPVKDGFVQEPGDWRWSSYHQIVGPIRSTLVAVDETLALLADDPETARKRFRMLLGEPLGDFVPQFDVEVQTKEPPPAAKARRTLDSLAQELESGSGLKLLGRPGPGRPRNLTKLRRRFAADAEREGYSHSEIARALGVCPSAVSQYLQIKF